MASPAAPLPMALCMYVKMYSFSSTEKHLQGRHKKLLYVYNMAVPELAAVITKSERTAPPGSGDKFQTSNPITVS